MVKMMNVTKQYKEGVINMEQKNFLNEEKEILRKQMRLLSKCSEGALGDELNELTKQMNTTYELLSRPDYKEIEQRLCRCEEISERVLKEYSEIVKTMREEFEKTSNNMIDGILETKDAIKDAVIAELKIMKHNYCIGEN